jgi:ATP-binding cassette subfamily F protein uup
MQLGGRQLFEKVNLDLRPGERLGIVGQNGLGKSTLLKLMLGQLPPATGEIEIGPRTEINYVDQSRTLLDDQKTVWEEVGEGSEYVRLGDESITLRGYLRRFLFTEDRINSKIELLSGGERSRVLLAKILKRGGNVLMLDEPTNDLDLGTLRLLEEALVAFKGCVVVVSHDRYFLNRVCTSILAFEGDSTVRYNAGDYDYYLEKRAERMATATTSPKAGSSASGSERPLSSGRKPRKLKWSERQELTTIEARILAAEEEVALTESQLADPEFYSKYGQNTQTLQTQLRTVRENVSQLYSRWEELERIRSES